MGTSHIDSNLVGKDGTETIHGFATISATTLSDGTISITGGALTGVASGSMTAMTITTLTAPTITSNSVTATGITANNITVSASLGINDGKFIRLGTSRPHHYIIFGAMTTQASVEAAATAVDASCQGSLYISSAGHAWIMTDNTTAASFTQS